MVTPPGNEAGRLHVFAATNEIAALCLEGEFDLANAPQIVDRGEGLLADEKEIILDLSDATLIDSSAIQALFRLAAEAGQHGRLVVLQLGTAAIVERALEISGLERVLPRVGTRSEAIDTIRELRRAGDSGSARLAGGSSRAHRPRRSPARP